MQDPQLHRARRPLSARPAAGKPQPPPEEPWPNGVVLTVRGAAPTVTLTLPAGEVKFTAGDVPLGEPKTFLDGQVRVERLPATSVLRPPADPKADAPVQDDYPAFWVRYKTGKQYLAWVAYQKEKDRVLLAERDGPDGDWSEPVEVAGPGDHFRVALASTHDDTLWVVWASQRDHNWDLYGRPYKDGKLGDEVRLTDDAGPDIWHRMTTDQRGRAWLVWQGFRDGQFDIFARCADGDGWHDAVRVSDGQGRRLEPGRRRRLQGRSRLGRLGLLRVRRLQRARPQPVRRAGAEARRRADAGAVAVVPGPSEPGLRPATAGCGSPGTRPGRTGARTTASSTSRPAATRLYAEPGRARPLPGSTANGKSRKRTFIASFPPT